MIDMEFAVIIVNWNVKDALRKCLESLARYGGEVKPKVIVVDNASSDGTVREFNVWRSNLAARFDLFKLIQNRTNRGFAAACNQGARGISNFKFQISNLNRKSEIINRHSYILFLNPDTQIQLGTLEGIVDFFQKHPKAGIVGGKILNANGTVQPSVRRFPGFWDQILILLGFPKGRTLARVRPLRRYFFHDFDYSREAEVDQVMGAFMAVRKSVFEQLQGFDEQFFLWFEEVDLCKRAKEAGLEVWYTPTVSVMHQGAGSFKQVSPLRRRMIWLKSLWHYANKHWW